MADQAHMVLYQLDEAQESIERMFRFYSLIPGAWLRMLIVYG